MGKTRLALTLAETLRHELSEGVVVAELGKLPGERSSPVADSHALLGVIDQLHGGSLAPRFDSAMAEQGESRPRLLLVLDNAEHLLGPVARLAEEAESRWPGISLIITSRRRARGGSGQVYEVAPLQADGPDAMQLLLSRLKTTFPDVELDQLDGAADLALMRALGHKLGGVPRLIEFAAEAMQAVPLAELAAPAFDISSFGSPAAESLPHQQSPLSSFEWSIDLLDEQEKCLLKMLAHLPLEFTMDDIRQSLVDHPERALDEMVAMLLIIVENSLVHVRRRRLYRYQVMPDVVVGIQKMTHCRASAGSDFKRAFGKEGPDHIHSKPSG